MNINLHLSQERVEELKRFENSIHIQFKNMKWLELAFTHKSYIKKKCEEHNQRLEFLGDSVLSFFMSEYLFNFFLDFNEGNLTKIKNQLVSEPILAQLAQKINLGPYLLLSHGEDKNKGREKPSVLADTFEAILGAIYCDQGIETAKGFLTTLYKDIIDEYKAGKELILDYKSQLQVLLQKKVKLCPHYKILDEKGPPNSKIFAIGLYIGDKILASGTGKNKKEAQQEAAKKALEEIEKKNLIIDSIALG